MSDSNTEQTDKENQIIGAITAFGRSVTFRFTSFYLRTPVKLFKPRRFDYLHYIRVILTGEENLEVKTRVKPKAFQNSSLYVLTKALNKYGWKIIPDRILPPLIANSISGVVLYTTYLQAISRYHNQSSDDNNSDTKYLDVFKAGAIAGCAQAIVTTPIDAIYARSSTRELFSSLTKYNNLWVYSWDKLKQIGPIGCFGGLSLTLLKESVGFASYFTTFSLVKDYCITRFGDKKWVKRSFIFVAGISASVVLQTIQYPFSKIQTIHYARLEIADMTSKYKISHFKIYWHAYRDTFKHLRVTHGNSLLAWLYKGYFRTTFSTIPSMTAGLILLDYMREHTSTDSSVNHTLDT